MNKPAPRAAGPAARAPQALKVDPPSWWAGHSLNPVRLLIRGSGLAGATVSAAKGSGLTLGRAKANAAGTWLFVDAHIAPGAAAGIRALEVRTPAGRCELGFELLRSSAAKRRRLGFSADDVVYLIMPDRFAQGRPPRRDPAAPPGMHDRSAGRAYHGGDLRGIIERLPYLKDLGATALWLTPLYANTRRLHPQTSWSKVPFTDYHGYGAVDYYAVDERLGDLDDLRELVEKARALGLKIILDQVNNHTGQHHPWVSDPPTPTWYHGTPGEHLDNPFQTWTVADPYASESTRKPALEGWFGGMLPDLNQDDPEMARYMIQNILWWAGISGADGLRHDVAGLVPRTFWRDCFKALKREHPGIRAVGEVNGDLPATVSHFQGGRTGFDGVDTGFDSLFDFPLRKAVRSVFLEGAPIEALPALLSQDRLYPEPAMLVTCLGLHDDPRFMGHPAATAASLKLAFSFLLTTRGIPLVYYGDEIALGGGEDPDNRRDFPGGWAEDSRDAFEDAGRTPEERDVFAHVRRLARLRAACEPLRRGRLLNLAAGASVYAYARLSPSARAIVVLNNGAAPAAVELWDPELGLPERAAVVKDRLGGADARVAAGTLTASVAARSAAVYTL